MKEKVMGILKIQEIIDRTIQEIKKISEEPSMINGTPTGFIDLDNELGGMKPGELLFICSRPSMGKTSLAIQLCSYFGLRSDLFSVMYSLKANRQEIGMRLLSQISQLDFKHIRTGYLSQTHFENIDTASKKISSLNFLVNDDKYIDVVELANMTEDISCGKDIGVLIVDSLQALQKNSNRINGFDLKDTLKTLKALAIKLKIPIVILSDVKREVEARRNKRPYLYDLIDGEIIENFASVILAIYQNDLYFPEKNSENIAEIIIRKNNGPLGVVKLRFNPGLSKFEEYFVEM
jgi:replicative DNA helicase